MLSQRFARVRVMKVNSMSVVMFFMNGECVEIIMFLKYLIFINYSKMKIRFY